MTQQYDEMMLQKYLDDEANMIHRSQHHMDHQEIEEAADPDDDKAVEDPDDDKAVEDSPDDDKAISIKDKDMASEKLMAERAMRDV